MTKAKHLSLWALVLASLPATALAEPGPALPVQPSPAPPMVELEARPASGPTVAPQTPATPEPAEPEGPAKKPRLRVALGLRVAFIATAGFDAYSKDDVLGQWSLEGTTTLLEGRRSSLALGLAYDVGGRTATTRTIETSLSVHRLSVPIEGRLHLAPWLYAFGRVAPGAILGLTRVKDPGAPSNLTGNTWLASADLSAGASLLLGPHRPRDARLVRVWVTPELGYSITTRPDVRPSPTGRDPKDVLGADAPANLGGLALSGFFGRLSVAVTF